MAAVSVKVRKNLVFVVARKHFFCQRRSFGCFCRGMVWVRVRVLPSTWRVDVVLREEGGA